MNNNKVGCQYEKNCPHCPCCLLKDNLRHLRETLLPYPKGRSGSRNAKKSLNRLFLLNY